MVQVFPEILNQKLTPKIGYFGFLKQLRTTKLIDEKLITKVASDIAQKSVRRVKLLRKMFGGFFANKFSFLYKK